MGLTHFAAFVIIFLGAARTAGGWPRHPKGGVAYAFDFTYRSLYGNDHCQETRQPPLCQVTVVCFSLKLKCTT